MAKRGKTNKINPPVFPPDRIDNCNGPIIFKANGIKLPYNVPDYIINLFPNMLKRV